MTIQQLRQPVEAEYAQFTREYRSRIFDQTPVLDKVGEYLDSHPGKQLRPLLVLLAAKSCGTVKKGHILLSAAVELLHNASLMHDDVVDESDTRRGGPSVRGRWGNPTAVLTGDYYLAQAMQLIQEANNPEASALVARTVGDMSRGELMQLSLTRCHKTTLEQYLRVIEDKTASLIATCCQLGTFFQKAPASSLAQPLRDFGHHYGIVFQLRDDLGSLDPRHDAALPDGTDTEALIAEHSHLAHEALAPIPPSPAREALLALLLPSAPQPA